MSSAPCRGRVVLVDDDLGVRRLLGEALGLEGFEVHAAGDAHEAWEVIERTQPDLVILDVMMPGGDGLSVLAHMRATLRHRDRGVVLLTARAQPEDVERGLRAGADVYLTKPFSIEQLVWHLDELRATPSTHRERSGPDPLERLRRLGPLSADAIVGRVPAVTMAGTAGVA